VFREQLLLSQPDKQEENASYIETPMPMKSQRTLTRKVEKIVLINANSGTTLLCAFCSNKSYPTVGMPTAGALKHTADEPIPDTDLLILFKN
jgi:hypothetical protein